jgi:branched-chain amino acid transport system substrate-binding protein
MDLTGVEAMVGKDQDAAFKLAFEAVGNKIGNRPVEIIVGDAQNKPNTAVDVAKKMVEQDKVVAIFGPTQVGEKMAVAGYCAQAGIPMFSYNPTPISLFQGANANKWVVGVAGSGELTSCMGDYLATQLKYKTINTLTQDNSAGHSFLDPLIKAFQAAGGQVVQSQWAPFPNQDYSTYLVNLKQADALVAWTSSTDAILLWNQYKQLGIDKKMPMQGAFHGGFMDPFIPAALADDAADTMVGKFTIQPYAPDSQDASNQAFFKAFKAKMNEEPGDDGSAGPYQAAVVFIELVKATNGDTAPAALMAALPKIKAVGPEGPVTFAPGSTCATVNEYILKVNKLGPKHFSFSTAYTYKDVPPTGFAKQ